MTESGLIVKGVGGKCEVLINGERYTCTPRGVFRNRGSVPLVGDHVKITITNEAKKQGVLHTILPRKNTLRRPMVANVSQAVVTVSAANPEFNQGLMDRFLIMIEDEDIPILVCINKKDLVSCDALELFEQYECAGYTVVFTDTINGEGIERLRQEMSGRINLFAGPSGVGKSSLINALLPDLRLETGELSTKNKRGKHTTRHTELFPIGDGFLFDTPGFTSLDITHVNPENYAYLFREFRTYLVDCKFSNCIHAGEVGCAVKEQVGKGIHPARYESYLSIILAV